MFLDQRKQAKMQWLRDLNQSNVDNLNNVRREASRPYSNKNKEYLKAKFDELETRSKIKRISETFIKTSMTSRIVTSLEYSKAREG
jgi:hypothetical protein